MVDLEERQKAMQQDVLLVAIATCSLVAGMHFSPWFDPIFFLLRPFLVPLSFGVPVITLYLTSLFIAIFAAGLGGIPAAIFERLRGQTASSPASLVIWLVGTALIAAPAVMAWGREVG